MKQRTGKNVRLPQKSRDTKEPKWHNPVAGDVVTCGGVDYTIMEVREYQNGNGMIKMQSPRGRMTLRSKLPFKDWAHWRGIAAGKTSSYKRS